MATQTEATQGLDPTIDGDDLSDTRLPEAVLKASTTKSPTPGTELLGTDAGSVEGQTVSLERSGAEHVTAERAIVSNSGVRSLDARSAQFDRSGVLSLQAEKTVLQESSAVAIVADEVRLVASRALVVNTRELSADDKTRILIGVGGAGEIRPVVSGGGAAAFGAALGLVLLVLGRLLGRRRG